jgi:hypothetical protein
MGWLPAEFMHPVWAVLPCGYHPRPVRAADTDLDYPAVMGSQERLWSIFGDAWGWPPAMRIYQHRLQDFTGHEAEVAAHEPFRYVLLDYAERSSLAASTSVRQRTRAPMPRFPGG